MLTVKEVAEVLRLDPETVRQRIVSGELEAFRVGRGRTSPYRVKEDVLEAYIKQQKVETPS